MTPQTDRDHPTLRDENQLIAQRITACMVAGDLNGAALELIRLKKDTYAAGFIDGQKAQTDEALATLHAVRTTIKEALDALEGK